jgi:hypothetical protein
MRPSLQGDLRRQAFARENLTSKGYIKRNRPTPGKQSYGSKLSHRCELQGCHYVSAKLPRIAGSFDFYEVPQACLRSKFEIRLQIIPTGFVTSRKAVTRRLQ